MPTAVRKQSGPSEPVPPPRSWLVPAVAGLLLGAVGCAWLLPESESSAFFWFHLLLPLLAVLLALPWVAAELRASKRDRWVRRSLAVAGICLLSGGVAWLPLPRLAQDFAVWLHAAAGTAVGVLLLVRLALRTSVRRKKAAGFGLAGLLIAPLGVYGVSEAAKQRQAVSPAPRYDAQACFRFLTATVADDSGAPLFPSALRFEHGSGAASTDCTRSGCHTNYTGDHPHTTTGTGPAYQKTLGDFLKRRGAEAARWCQGCHAPESLRQSSAITYGMEAETFTCLTCHGTRELHAAYGNAALALGAAPNLGQAGGLLPDAPWLRRKQHSENLLRPHLRNSSEFCGSCHRKNWSLPQNEYRWLPGPDEYRNWRESAYSGLTSYASGSAMVTKGCTGCHTPHPSPSNASKEPGQPSRRFMALDAFLRRDTPVAIAPVDRSLAPRPGETVLLDVVVRNTGIGHDFPTGMPDLQESWLEVRVEDGKGAPALANGIPPSGSARDNQAHFYRLVALDRQGHLVQHGDLDRMVGVAEWRRIAAGEADLARYRFTVPKTGLGTVSVRLLRRQRPEFARWAGETPTPPELLAETRLTPLGPTAPPLLNEGGDYLVRRWREYGAALTRVQAYPQAIQALNRALAQTPTDPETLLALGQVFWQEGDLLAAREQFRRAATAAPEDVRPLAWDARVERKMGQLESAARMLAPLIRRFPRDTKLRFELGLALMDQLQNEEAAREFEAILDVDPLNGSAHYNLMRCRQRLNQLTGARREEVIYRLLNQDDAPPLTPAAGQPPFREDQLLHVHTLEPHP